MEYLQHCTSARDVKFIQYTYIMFPKKKLFEFGIKKESIQEED